MFSGLQTKVSKSRVNSITRRGGGGAARRGSVSARAPAPLAPVVLVRVRVACARLVPVGQPRRRRRQRAPPTPAPSAATHRQRRLVAQRSLVRSRGYLRLVRSYASVYTYAYFKRNDSTSIRAKQSSLTVRALSRV